MGNEAPTAYKIYLTEKPASFPIIIGKCYKISLEVCGRSAKTDKLLC